MKVLERPLRFLPDPPRDGHHCSAIIKDLLISMDPKRYGRPIDDAARARFELGYGWEETLIMRGIWPRHVITQIPIIHDGITCTLDGLDLRKWAVRESKATLLSTKHEITGPIYAGWRWQLMAYCYVAEVHKAILDVIHIMGDYRGSGPIAKRYLFRFSPRELQMNWTMLRRHRDRMVKEGKLPYAA